jgi:3-phenylpropionate/trans-cinnamate dioxygenase ferredoxin subunit
VQDIPPGTRRIVIIEGRSVGVLNVGGTLYALRNACPHQGAPLCLGRVLPLRTAQRPFQIETDAERTVVKCPWHGWEFDVATGRSIFNPHRTRVKAYDVTVGSPANDDVVLETFQVTVEGDAVIVHA